MPWQREILFCTARFMGVFAGRRAGKTDAIKGRIKLRTQRPGFSLTYVTPLSAQGLEVYNEIIGDLSFAHHIRKKRERPFPQIWLRNGSRIKVKSFQRPEGLRSTGEDEIILDESQDPVVTERAVDSVILPMLADKRGTLVMSGQFRGTDFRYNRFYVPGQQFIDGKPNPLWRPMYWSCRIPTSAGFKFQSQEGREELEMHRGLVPKAVWEQEWLCLPASNMSAVFPAEQIDSIQNGETHSSGIAGHRYIGGLDLGRVVDSTAIVILDVQTGTVVHAERLPVRMEHALQAKKVAEIANRYRACIVMDVTGGATGGHAPKDSYVQFYRQTIRDLREFYWQKSNKEKIISELALHIERRAIAIPAVHKDLIEELRAYEYEYKGGYYDYHAPRGRHDDYVSALAMAVWGMKSGWAPNPNGTSLSAAWT